MEEEEEEANMALGDGGDGRGRGAGIAACVVAGIIWGIVAPAPVFAMWSWAAGTGVWLGGCFSGSSTAVGEPSSAGKAGASQESAASSTAGVGFSSASKVGASL